MKQRTLLYGQDWLQCDFMCIQQIKVVLKQWVSNPLVLIGKGVYVGVIIIGIVGV